MDRAQVNAKLTPDPIGPKVQRIKLGGGRQKVARKTYIRGAEKFCTWNASFRQDVDRVQD
jgi:hypothetical protein